MFVSGWGVEMVLGWWSMAAGALGLGSRVVTEIMESKSTTRINGRVVLGAYSFVWLVALPALLLTASLAFAALLGLTRLVHGVDDQEEI